MWIRSQNKKDLVNVIKVEISGVVGDKDNKAEIWGQFASRGLFSINTVSLGRYSTVEEAIKEIDKIEKIIIENPSGVYQMSSNK